MPLEAKFPPARPFGAVLTAMVTPFQEDLSLDEAGVRAVAAHLVRSGCDGLVLNGTTGESPTTSVEEKLRVIELVREEVGTDVTLVAGVGSYNTAADVDVVKKASEVADGLLALPPFYSKPTQEGILAHFHTLADAASKPIMMYDIPSRVGVPIATDTMIELAKHPQIVAVKDAKADLWEATRVLAETDLAWYSGSDEINLAHIAAGAAGVVSVIGHGAARQLGELIALVDAGRVAQAATIQRKLIGITQAMCMQVPGAIASKACLQALGVLDNRRMRCPMVEASDEVYQSIASALKELA